MRMYDVIILPKAEEDVLNNTDWQRCHSPETALRLAAGFRNTIARLEFMPEQHELDEDEELAEKGIRRCYYKNYKIFFYVNESSHSVYILRVLHMLVDSKPLLLKMHF